MMERYEKLNEISSILTSLALGKGDVRQREALDVWRAESPLNEQLYQEVASGRFARRKFQFVCDNDINAAYTEFRRLVAAHRRRAARRRIARAAGIAASIVLAAGVYQLLPRNNPPAPVTAAHTAAPGSPKAILTTGDGEQIDISGRQYTDVAAQVEPLTDSVGAAGPADENLRYHTITIPRNGEYSFELDDGTKIHMNAESQVRIPVPFGVGRREVFVRGEAYFEVSADHSSPFTVHTRHGQVTVLGTEFNLRDYNDEDYFAATLVSGSIIFEHEGRGSSLSPGEQLRLDKATGTTTVSQVDTGLYTSWKDGRFNFRGQRLEEIMNTLARWYDMEVSYESAGLKDILFTGNIPKYDRLGQVLELLSMVNKVRIECSGRNIVVRAGQ